MVINRLGAVLAILVGLSPALGYGETGALWCPVDWSDGRRDHHAWFPLQGGSCDAYRAAEVTRLYRRPDLNSKAQTFAGGIVVRFSRQLDAAEAQAWFASRGIEQYHRRGGIHPFYLLNSPADISTLGTLAALITDPVVKTAVPNWRQPLVAK